MFFKVVSIIHEVVCSLKITEKFLRVVTTVILISVLAGSNPGPIIGCCG